jgi:hypothetical protein
VVLDVLVLALDVDESFVASFGETVLVVVA